MKIRKYFYIKDKWTFGLLKFVGCNELCLESNLNTYTGKEGRL